MRFYISTGAKRVTISTGVLEEMKVKGSQRRLFSRSVLPAVLIVGVLLPFLFISAAFVALEGANKCSSSVASTATSNCIGWRLGPAFFTGSGTSPKLGNELRRTFLEAKEAAMDVDSSSLNSFNDLVTHMSSNGHDLKTFISRTKAMLLKLDQKVRSAEVQRLMYKQLASIGIPKSMHCLSLRLAEEYTVNALARLPLPSPELVSILTNTSYHHVALLTDNVLAASVAVTSIVRSSSQPEKMVIHVITDKKTYAPMHAWFALNPVGSVVAEVKGLHQFDWPDHVNMGVMEMKEIHRLIRGHYFYYYEDDHRRLEAMRPNHLSLLNYLRIYLPELFPELDRIVFLDDDVVVRRDLSPLWALNLDGKVNGAVSSRGSNRERGDCLGGRYGDYFNFSDPIISSKFDSDSCAWLYGLNVFDLNEWRRSNITQTYHRWLKLNLDSGFTLWHLGALTPALAAFHGHVQPIDPSWHVSGLGHQSLERDRKMVEAAAVIHFSGPAKPWLQIGFSELRRYWAVNVNYSNEYIRACNIE